jgi:uncharacterized alpha-E superfamily protein
MYRQYVRRRVTGADVVGFLLHDPDFPRSVTYCVAQLDGAAAKLPRQQTIRARLADLQAALSAEDVASLDHASVHRFVDELQLEFAALDRSIFETWLNPVRAS